MENSSSNSHRSILVIDDNPEMAEVIRLTLEEMGHTVIERHDGGAGLQAFQDAPNSIDLILLDVAMGDMNGIDVLTGVRAVSDSVPVIFVSGYIQSKAEALSLGANGVLVKPFSMRDLEKAVKPLLKSG